MPGRVTGQAERAGGANARCRWLYVELAVTDYKTALDLQHRLLEGVRSGRLGAGVVLALEHRPVLTLGRRGGRENLCVSEDFLSGAGISIVPAERGGNITYHGPGQLVVYPVVDLKRLNLGVADFVTGLEEVMIRTAREWKIAASRNPVNRGVWVGPNKLGSIGIAVRRGISFHGLALNVSPDLTPFAYIRPCGLENVSMTSMAKESGRPVPLKAVRAKLAGHLAAVFGVRLIETDPLQFEA